MFKRFKVENRKTRPRRPHQSLDGLTPEEKMQGVLWKPPPKDAKRVPRVERHSASGDGLLAYYKKAA